jgi:hypothetical protein
MMPEEKAGVLRPRLEEAQKALEAALDEACEVDVADADTSELIRVEESLTVAREAAKIAISVLQRLHRDKIEQDKAERDVRELEAHRLFIDARGAQWDAFAVYPSSATAGRKALPAQYHRGWLSFQSGAEVRRLTPIPEGWRQLGSDGLRHLLEKAEIAPRRIRQTETEVSRSATAD